MGLVTTAQTRAHLGAQRAQQGLAVQRDDRDTRSPLPRARRDLAADEPGAQHHDIRPGRQLGAKGQGVVSGPERVTTALRSGNREPARTNA